MQFTLLAMLKSSKAADINQVELTAASGIMVAASQPARGYTDSAS
jgi:hypothetical protein